MYDVNPLCSKDLYSDPKIQRIFKIYKGKFFSKHLFFIFIFKQLSSQHRMNRCEYWGPDGRLDTKVDPFDWCHISMSYASFVIIWHLMSYDAYDIEIWHKSNWSILVSKRPSGLQKSHLLIWQKLKNTYSCKCNDLHCGNQSANLRKLEGYYRKCLLHKTTAGLQVIFCLLKMTTIGRIYRCWLFYN